MAKKRRNVTYEKFDKVIQLIENEGFSLRKACLTTKMSFQVFDGICSEDEEKNKHYTRAKEKRTELIFEEMLEIANTPCEAITTTIRDDGRTEQTKFDNVQHRRLQIDTRKWMLGKLQPKKYGDKLDLTSDGKEMKNTPNMTITIVPPNIED
jgi:hypothetical protein